MNCTKSFVIIASLLFVNSNLLCHTVYVRNQATYPINAEVKFGRLGGSSVVKDIYAFNIAPGEERHIATGIGCVSGIALYCADTKQGIKEWYFDKGYRLFEAVGDRLPCGSNVITYTDDNNGPNICHLGVHGDCDGKTAKVGSIDYGSWGY